MESGVRSAHKLYSLNCYTVVFKLSYSQVKEKSMRSYAVCNISHNDKIISIACQ
jgi:hypothetical protein